MPKFEKKYPYHLGEIDWGRIRWGLEKCESEGCYNDADLIWNGRGLYCVDCCDLILERILIKESGLKPPQAQLGLWYEPPPYDPEATKGKG